MNLNWAGQQLTELPTIDPAVINLELHHNHFQSLADWPTELPHLRLLRLDHNHLVSLAGFPRCPRLEYVDVQHNRLTGDLTPWVTRITAECPLLTTVNLAHNRITAAAVIPQAHYQHWQHNILTELNRLAPRSQLLPLSRGEDRFGV